MNMSSGEVGEITKNIYIYIYYCILLHIFYMFIKESSNEAKPSRQSKDERLASALFNTTSVSQKTPHSAKRTGAGRGASSKPPRRSTPSRSKNHSSKPHTAGYSFLYLFFFFQATQIPQIIVNQEKHLTRQL